MLFLLKSRKTVCELREKLRINYFTNEKNRFNKRFSSNTYGAPDAIKDELSFLTLSAVLIVIGCPSLV